MSIKRKSQYSFSRVPSVNIGRSVFNQSFGYKTTMDSGYLVPVSEPLEVLPGDTWNVNVTSFARLATPVCPFMDNLCMDFFAFFVPNRLVWNLWQNFMGEYDGLSDLDITRVPYFLTDGTDIKVDSLSLADYFGIPPGVSGIDFMALPFVGYQLIWADHFADENLIGDFSAQVKATLDDDTGSAPLSSTLWSQLNKLQRRGKRHDYFTSCLPWPQKGPGVEIPLAGNAPIVIDGAVNAGDRAGINNFSIGEPVVSSLKHYDVASETWSNQPLGLSQLAADMSAVTAATINSWRQAFQLQIWEEAEARCGSRYPEILLGHFGVSNGDARLQRTEYLGGGSIPINVHSVAQTSSTDSTTPQGNLAAIGTSGGHVGFSKSFSEHGYIFILASVRADLTYQQGLARHWSRKTKFDYYWPEFAHLGEQAVLNKEIYAQGTSDDDAVFGYQERWAEYRYGRSLITGLLRSQVNGSLDVWHLAQHFESLPTLSQDFIEEHPPVDRVLAVQNEPQFIYDSVVNVRCARAMPVYSVPGMIDHRF